MGIQADQKTYAGLREAYPKFIYHSYTLKPEGDRVTVDWHFEIAGLAHFRPHVVLNLPSQRLYNDPEGPLAHRLAFLSGMAELVSYWKITCSPCVEVRAGYLTGAEIEWWKDLYFGGLGEFFFLNKISPRRADFMELYVGEQGPGGAGQAEPSAPAAFRSAGLNVIPVGGGKDSVVSLVRLAPCRDQSFTFGINPTPAALDCMNIAGFSAEKRLLVERQLAPEMLDLNRAGYLNGHTPFSAVVAFNALLAAYLIGAERIILSNEASADEASVPGTEINHQYSKTTTFERAFRQYVEEQLRLPIHYFSLLRPFNELCIARDFAAYPAFFSAFRSCNAGSKENKWCGHCAKCLFIAIMLAPFVGLPRLRAIFGRDILADPDLSELLDELTGAKEIKAFECVGTVSEVRFALNRLLLQFHPFRRELDGPTLGGPTVERTVKIPARDEAVWRTGSTRAAVEDECGSRPEESLPVLVEHYLKQCQSGLFPDLPLDAAGWPYNRPGGPNPLTCFHDQHAVPADLLPCLKGMNRPDLTDYLAGRKILILGFGREGQAALNWLAVHAGELGLRSVGLADRQTLDRALVDRLAGALEVEIHSGPDYLQAVGQYDFVLKSPGISFKDYTACPTGRRTFKSFGRTLLSGQTDLLLEAGLPRDIIGVTGTKGKSTTTALVASLLQAAGRSFALAGNIGRPILSLYDQWTADTVVALELSSHQLQFTWSSPRVAVITNFYEEHLDHYRSYDEYLSAKLNILRYQDEQGLAVLCAGSEELMARALPEVKGKLVLVCRGHLSETDLAGGATACFAHLSDQLPGGRSADFFRTKLAALYTYEGRSVERIDVGADGESLLRTRLFEVDADHPALPGSHHLCDAAMAAAAVQSFVPDELLASGVKAFKGLPHRSEYIGHFAGIKFYNDSIATIPAATELALATLPQVSTLLVGGMDRGIDYTAFIADLAKAKLSCLIGLPETGYRICDALLERQREMSKEEASAAGESAASGGSEKEGGGSEKDCLCAMNIFKAADMDEAVRLAFRYTPPGTSCLLSPAASSYNIYKSFEERGNHFKRAVINQAWGGQQQTGSDSVGLGEAAAGSGPAGNFPAGGSAGLSTGGNDRFADEGDPEKEGQSV